jgi:hypothetical protein
VAEAFSTCRALNNSEVPFYEDSTETEKFCRIFNKLFDCFTTRSLEEFQQKRNNDLAPYKDANDERLFVSYFIIMFIA